MLLHVVRCPPDGLLRPGLVLIDAHRNHHSVPCVNPIVSHESWDIADVGYKTLFYLSSCLLGVGDALIAPYRSVHDFCATSFPIMLPHGALFYPHEQVALS